MRPMLSTLCLLAFALPAVAEEVHPDQEIILDCTLTRSCSSGGCGEEDVNARFTLTGEAAHYTDQYTDVDMLAQPDPVTGTITFATSPDVSDSGAMAHFATVFGDGAMFLTVHNYTTEEPVAITFDGKCEVTE